MQTQALSTYSNLELALMVLLGYFGNGQARVKALGSRYNDVQGVVDQILITQAIPSGSGSVTTDTIRSAVKNVFADVIEEISEDIANEIE